MLKIWCNTQFSGKALTLLMEGVSPHHLVFAPQLSASNLAPAEADPELLTAHIAFGQPDPACILQSERLRWIQLTSAGYTRYDTPEFRAAVDEEGMIVTNSSQVYAGPGAEHVLAFMLAHGRRLPQALDIQRADRSWPALPFRAQSRLLKGQNVVVLGFGAIGRRLVELLAPFKANITALRRHTRGHESVETIPEEQLEAALSKADHVVNLLPETGATRGFMSAIRFASMKPGAAFYNIGRGTTIDQEALLKALNSRTISGAYLDVTDPEPLPAEHPLWSAPNCLITPHMAGGYDAEPEALVEHFIDNLNQYITDSPMKDRVM
ncbi:MAG: D-isomer specific 2-hydroxyacid dehydrogenase NAD-binding [Chthoniobacteraceae bacterium]|nr:D-isomer specific 2-hydroxyacid dehydrogenase NAD-binding [Chthoniobacteraceae bacterium]